jgi:galactose oxidase-like protein/concanavalin A-like lectin/glucanase superfamily protein/Big-like domain-containing protein/Kelch motif protein
LVAAWGFDEGSGAIADDRSGNRNAGTVVGAAWTTQGRFGGALVFDGTTSRVTGPSVTLGPAFTLMAWVLNPTRTAYETMITVGRTRDLYLASGAPSFYTGDAEITFGSAIADGVWHHVALVSDGTTLRTYLDGASWGVARTIALSAVTGVLQVGAWIQANNTDYFAGTIDEVRVYNRALAQGEIQTVMTLPVAGSSTVLTLTAPANGATVLGTTVTATYTVLGDLRQYGHAHLYLDDNPVRMDIDRDGVYRFTNVPVGTHTLRAVPARADHWEFGTASTVEFVTEVDPADPTPPTVALLSPAARATVSGVVTLEAEASDNVAVAGVQFFVDGVALESADTAAPWTTPWNTALAPDGQRTLTVVARDTAGHVATSAPVVVTVSTDPSSPAVIGQWGPVLSWPIAPVHMLVQRTGEVLLFNEANGGQSARLWNPATGTFTPVPTASNIFCAGHALLADGRSVVIGGQLNPCCYVGIVDTNLFDATTRAWNRVADMNFPRWYPTATTLPDGRILAISGWIVPGQLADTPEVYDPARNVWTPLSGATRSNPMYSFMFVLPDGTVLNAGPDPQTRRLDVAASRWIDVGDSFISGHSAVMYRPGLVMKSGTHGDPDNRPAAVDGRTVVIDMTRPAPAWREVAPMAFPRAYHNLTILPDGSVLATGGGTTGAGENTGAAVREAELWNPETETWRTLAPMARPRLYHSGALLLPDGRVLMAGGNLGYYFEPNAELYSPPYLFKGTRPTITGAPATVAYGARFVVATPDAASITEVSLVRSGAPTHGFDQSQGFVHLPFAAAPNGLDVTAPANARLAPPGDYMLFILNASGVPSLARFVRLAS